MFAKAARGTFQRGSWEGHDHRGWTARRVVELTPQGGAPFSRWLVSMMILLFSLLYKFIIYRYSYYSGHAFKPLQKGKSIIT